MEAPAEAPCPLPLPAARRAWTDASSVCRVPSALPCGRRVGRALHHRQSNPRLPGVLAGLQDVQGICARSVCPFFMARSLRLWSCIKGRKSGRDPLSLEGPASATSSTGFRPVYTSHKRSSFWINYFKVVLWSQENGPGEFTSLVCVEFTLPV